MRATAPGRNLPRLPQARISKRSAGLGAALGVALGAVLAMSVNGPAQAQANFPTRPITIVVPYPAGGAADLLCRFAGEKASAILGQQVVVENRPGGAGGRIGIEQVMRAPADGYTLLCATQLNYSITHLIFSKAAFDPRGLEPISVLATYPLIVIARPSLPANNMQEFIAYARANPGKVNYGNQGKGNTGHLLGELMMLKANFRMTEIPYRGSAPAINDLLAGTIDMVPDYLLANKGNIDAGKLKLLATAGHERLKDYPTIATIAETLPGVFSETWMAISAPPGTPKEITNKISDAIGQGYRQPDMQARILKLEAQPLGSTPDQMRDMIKKSLDTWEPVVKAAKITID
jgi:tripartite-type tricarboxylate transporter receptor subunit TctC